MKIISSTFKNKANLPFKLVISFEAIFEYLEKIALNNDHHLFATANDLLNEYKKYPILRSGFEDLSYLETYNKEIDKLLTILFPDLLQDNEIKAASIPFEFTTFKLSKRFEKIIDDAGEGYTFDLQNFEESNMYILACTFILGHCYNVDIDFKRPIFFDIPNLHTGITKHYRALMNGDFLKVKALPSAPKISTSDVKILLDNFNNLEVWKEKFPPKSYEFKGFGIINLFDVTSDQSIAKVKEHLIKPDTKSFEEVELSIAKIFNSKSVKFGFSTYSLSNNNLLSKNFKTEKSFILRNRENFNCTGYFCKGIISKVFESKQLFAISDIDAYGEKTNYNGLYQSLKNQKIKSVILVPIRLNNDMYGVMELVSTKKYELNSINAYKLNDVIPAFKVAIKRLIVEYQNKLESVIQENYTALHPTVKWKFYEQAEKYLASLDNLSKPKHNLQSVVFENVIPLYGQSDIKDSSVARNKAIQQDLTLQLTLANSIIKNAFSLYKLPIYNDLAFRINDFLKQIKNGLKTDDEVKLLEFLNNDIYPVFNYLNKVNPNLKVDIENYMSQLDSNLNMVYNKRKKYEESVSFLNESIANYIDAKQIEAQKMFPHYFERYKTDGVDYTMYIGQSLVNSLPYDPIYLHNLRLWQLQLMCEVENLAFNLKTSLEFPLEITSLILVHSNPLAIKFRMDEKQFDIDGAYNIRYEIIKKRIDKALIKNTNQRLTQVGKIAIIYSHQTEAEEYLKYIKFLQANNYLLNKIEFVEIEDLQGVSGLKGILVGVNYKNANKNIIEFNDLLEALNEESAKN